MLLLTINSDAIYKHKTEYRNDGGSSNSFVSHTRAQEQFELNPESYNRASCVPRNRAKQDTIIPSQTAVTHSLPLIMQTSAKPLLARISDLCQKQFQSEPWYLDNMRFAIAVMTGVACFILVVFAEGQSGSFPDVAVVLIVFVATVVCLPLIPLCGILDGLGPKQLAQRHPLSVVRLAVDPGKTYRVLRYIYFLCCPISAISSGIVFRFYGYIALALMAIWGSFFLIASPMVPISIYRQLYS